MLWAWVGNKAHLTQTALPKDDWAKGVTLCGYETNLKRTDIRPDEKDMCKNCRQSAKTTRKVNK